MVRNNVLISIIIPSYNRSELIAETLDSVLGQTFQNWECIVVDDGSTDNTEKVVNEYCMSDSRFSFYKRPKNKIKGANACRNFGLKQSEGEFIVFLDSDDIILPFALDSRLKIMQANDSDMVISHSRAFSKVIGDQKMIWNRINSNATTNDLLIRFLKSDMPWCTHGVLWKKSMLIKIKGWDEHLDAWQDWDLHCRALFESPKISIAGGAPDNCFRRSDHESIGSLFRSKVYFNSLIKLIISTNKTIRQNRKESNSYLKYFKQFILSKGIEKPLAKGFNTIPLRLLFRPRFIVGVSRIYFLKVYLIQFLGKSYKIRKYIFKNIYTRQQSMFISESTHLKLTIDDL